MQNTARNLLSDILRGDIPDDAQLFRDIASQAGISTQYLHILATQKKIRFWVDYRGWRWGMLTDVEQILKGKEDS